MNDFNHVGKLLMIIGTLLFIIGLFFFFTNKLPFFGKLPGDFSWKGKNWGVYFPLGSSILISILLSLILFIIKKFNQ
jgi:hypothetical protein